MMRDTKFQVCFANQNGLEEIYTVTIGELIEGVLSSQYCTESIIWKRQYTELKDKNDVEIYEGDIVLVKAEFGTRGKHPKKIGETIDVLAEVIFRKGGFVYKEPAHEYQKRIDNGNATDWYRVYPHLTDCEVIGNIHQNPELINV